MKLCGNFHTRTRLLPQNLRQHLMLTQSLEKTAESMEARERRLLRCQRIVRTRFHGARWMCLTLVKSGGQLAIQEFTNREKQRQIPVTHRTRTVARMERRIQESLEVSGTGADASVTKKRIFCSCDGTKRDVAHISPRARRLPRVDQGQGKQYDRNQTKERREPPPNGSS